MTARVAIFEGAGRPFRFAEQPLPEAGLLAPGEALVKIALATICGSDLHTVQGRRRGPTPCVLGHEAAGSVVAAGAGREAWVGRRVTWTLADSCGTCRPCLEWDLPQKCTRLFKYGHAALTDGSGLNGTYASHILLRPGTHLVALPDAIPDPVAAPANCALATMVAASESLPKPCRMAVIQGAGLLGLYGCALLRAAGVSRVLVIDPEPARRAHIAAFGGEAVANAADLPSHEADLVIEAAGVASVVQDGLRLLRVGGHYVLVGLVHPDSQLDITGEALVRGWVTLRGVHNYAPRHLEKAITFLGENTSLPWASLVSPVQPLERLDAALALAESRQWARVAVGME